MSVEEPKFLTIAEILYLHNESLARFGGSAGVRDLGLVESAAASAQNAFWLGRGGLFDIAAAYAFHIARYKRLLMETSGPLFPRRFYFCGKTMCNFPWTMARFIQR